jgi:hypothetical protein
MATALFLCNNHLYGLYSPRRQTTHVCSSGLQNWNPRSETRLCSCSDNHGLVAKPPTRNAFCLSLVGGSVQGYQSGRTELLGRRRLKLSLMESAVDWIEGSKNFATSALYTGVCGRRRIGGASVSLPCQRQPSSPDPIVGIIVSWGTKSDVLVRGAVRNRKDLLHPLVEPLGKRREVFWGVEPGEFQLF